MEKENKPIEEDKSAEEAKTVEEVNLEKDVQKVKPIKSKKIFYEIIMLALLTLILVSASAAGSYWWRDQTANEFEKKQADEISTMKKTITSLESQLAAEKAKDVETDGDTVCTPISPNATTIENIKASITSGNTQALEGYMASSVNTILAATEAYGPQTPTQSVGDITSFISENSTWDFSLSASILSSYGQSGYGQYFPNIAVVGKSADGKVISFSFDCNGDIVEVFMASSELIL